MADHDEVYGYEEVDKEGDERDYEDDTQPGANEDEDEADNDQYEEDGIPPETEGDILLNLLLPFVDYLMIFKE